MFRFPKHPAPGVTARRPVRRGCPRCAAKASISEASCTGSATDAQRSTARTAAGASEGRSSGTERPPPAAAMRAHDVRASSSSTVTSVCTRRGAGGSGDRGRVLALVPGAVGEHEDVGVRHARGRGLREGGAQAEREIGGGAAAQVEQRVEHRRRAARGSEGGAAPPRATRTRSPRARRRCAARPRGRRPSSRRWSAACRPPSRTRRPAARSRVPASASRASGGPRRGSAGAPGTARGWRRGPGRARRR